VFVPKDLKAERRKLPFGRIMRKECLNQMKSLWQILNVKEPWSPVCNICISEKVLAIRMLSPCDAKEETAKAEYIQ
jgi:hypothetical protein